MSSLPRKSGVLLHILPSRSLRHRGYRAVCPKFSAFLARSGQKLWQVLPLQETSPALEIPLTAPFRLCWKPSLPEP
ncbi:hypothetical protein MASR2M17_06780 [Aminivibrio sp.]